jgi:hypothetical protein
MFPFFGPPSASESLDWESHMDIFRSQSVKVATQLVGHPAYINSRRPCHKGAGIIVN